MAPAPLFLTRIKDTSWWLLCCVLLLLPAASHAKPSPPKTSQGLQHTKRSSLRQAHRRRWVAQRRKRRKRRKRPKGGTAKKAKSPAFFGRCRVKWSIKVRLDFKEADILTVVKWIAKQTCQNFIVASNIRGQRLHIISESAITLRNAYKAFFAALEASNMTAVRSSGIWKVIRAHKARQNPVRTYTDGKLRHPNRAEMVTYLYEAKHLNTARASTILRSLTSPSGGLIYQPNSSVIIITDYASNLYRVLRILRAIDVPQAESKEDIHVLQVQYAKAQEIAQKLRQIFQVGRRRTRRRTARRPVRRRPRKRGKRKRRVIRRVKATTTTQNDDDESAYRLSKLVADDRTNQIIVLANNRAIKRVKKLLKDLDLELPGDGQIRVHYLKYASADELAQTLSQITQGTRQRRRVRRRRRRSGPKKAAELFEGEVKVTADKATNALVIVASRRDFESLLRVIHQLDISRKQVFVEIVILELSLDKSRELGLTFHLAQNPSGQQDPSLGILGTRLGGQNTLVLDPTALTGLAFGLQGKAVEGIANLLGANITSIPSFGVLLRALQSNTDVDIISTPHILTTTNKEALLQVGQNVPFIAGTTFTGVSLPGVPNIRNVQRQDVALTIKLKPQVDAGDYVRLDFEQELTELAGNDPELGPTTTKRKIKTVVLAHDRQTVVIGGLVRDKVTNGVSKVPILGDIPLLGTLFRVTNKKVEKRNMLVFLTPHIINHMSDFRKIFERKMKERQQFVELFYTRKDRKFPSSFNYSRTTGIVEHISKKLQTSRIETKRMRERKVPSAQETLNKRNKPKKRKAAKPNNDAPPPMPMPRVRNTK